VRSSGNIFRGGSTGDRPSPPGARVVEDQDDDAREFVAPLSLRLRGARLQQRWADAAKGLPSSTQADMGGEANDLGICERGRLLGEGLERLASKGSLAEGQAVRARPTPGMGFAARGQLLSEGLAATRENDACSRVPALSSRTVIAVEDDDEHAARPSGSGVSHSHSLAEALKRRDPGSRQPPGGVITPSEAAAEQLVPLADSGATGPPHPGLGLVARSHMLNEALGKRARTSLLPSAAAAEARGTDGGGGGTGSGGAFQRGRLGEWMELAVQHAPPTRKGQHRRAVPGGMQDAYIHAVRRYLTEASLASQAAASKAAEVQAQSTAQGSREEALVPAEVAEPATSSSAVLVVVSGFDGLEGTVVSARVSEESTTRRVKAGNVIRLLLHRRHPVFQKHGDWVPEAGERLAVKGFQLVGTTTRGRGQLLLPVEVWLLADPDVGGATPGGAKRGRTFAKGSSPLPAWDCLS